MTSNIDRQLTLINYSTFRSSLLLIAIGVYLLITAGRTTRITCDRTHNQCQILKEKLLQDNDKQVVPLENVQAARVTQRQSENNPLYATVLDTDEKTIDLSGYSSAWRGFHARAVADINQFLGNPEKSSIDKRFGQVFLGILTLPLLGGIGILFLSYPVVQVTINSSVQVMVLTRRRWWKNQPPETYIPLNTIKTIEVICNTETHPSNPTYTAAILLKSGENVPLFNFKKSKFMASRQAKRLKAYLEEDGTQQ